jgi:hypothetical protein
MKTIAVTALTLLSLAASSALTATVQDKGWHMSFHFSGVGQSNDLDDLIEDYSPMISGGTTDIGIRAFASLTKSVSHTFAAGIRAGVFGEGSSGYAGASGGTGTELFAIAEARTALSQSFGLKGTAGVGRVSFSKGIVALGTDSFWGWDLFTEDATASTVAVLLEPCLEIRLSSVVTLEVIGAYRFIPAQTTEVPVYDNGQERMEEINLLKSGFSMGGGIGFHF